MSRVGKLPVKLPKGIKVNLEDGFVVVEGTKGKIKRKVVGGLEVELKENEVRVIAKNNDSRTKALHGTLRAHIANMVHGVTEGWSKTLELVGAGYRVEMEGSDLILRVGYSHPVKINAPEGITFSIKKNDITIEGVDRDLVGDIAAKIRKVRPPEPYKGKGIRYKGEEIIKKAGKAAKAQGAVA